MTITVFSAYPFEQPYLTAAAQNRHRCHFVGVAPTLQTAEPAAGRTAVAVFVNDKCPVASLAPAQRSRQVTATQKSPHRPGPVRGIARAKV